MSQIQDSILSAKTYLDACLIIYLSVYSNGGSPLIQGPTLGLKFSEIKRLQLLIGIDLVQAYMNAIRIKIVKSLRDEVHQSL